MSKVAIQGNASGTGTFTISAPNSNTDRALVLPDEAGTVLTSASSTVLPKGGPAFSAYNSTGQSISSATWTKVLFDTEEYDTANCFASSRFTPNVAGYYQVNYQVDAYAAGFNLYGIPAIYKNGSAARRGIAPIVTANVTEVYMGVSAVVYLNGSTDYIEMYINITSSSPPTLYGASSGVNGYFQATLVRAA